MVVNTGDNRYATSNYIVAPTIAEGANFTTITSAVAAAPSGSTVLIKPGTYTENFTLPAGVTICAYPGSQNATAHTVIKGKITISGTGTFVIASIRLSTNGDYCLEVTNAATVRCTDVCFRPDDFACINISAAAIVQCDNCITLSNVSANKLFNMSAGTLEFTNLQEQYTTGGISTVANTVSGGTVKIYDSTLITPITSSSTGALSLIRTSILSATGTNVTSLTVGGSGTSSAIDCYFSSGTASAISVSGSCTLTLATATIDSTNAAVVTGAGTLIFSGLVFSNTGTVINTTTRTYYSTTSKTTKFTGSTTWTRDNRCRSALIIAWGGGGGGGSGASVGAGISRSGGGGGSNQGMFIYNAELSTLGATETITIGAGGGGGAFQTAGGGAGNNGTNGGVSTFGNISTYSGAVNSFGTGGNTTTVAGGSPPICINNFNGVTLPGTGGNSQVNANGGDGTDAPAATGIGSCLGGGAAGGGGARDGGGTNYAGGRGGNLTTWAAAPSTLVAGGTAGTATNNGGAGNNASGLTSGGIFGTGTGGGGSGGGGGSTKNGGAGGIPGGGGGGGGAAVSGATSSGGGSGARGEIWIIEYF